MRHSPSMNYLFNYNIVARRPGALALSFKLLAALAS